MSRGSVREVLDLAWKGLGHPLSSGQKAYLVDTYVTYRRAFAQALRTRAAEEAMSSLPSAELEGLTGMLSDLWDVLHEEVREGPRPPSERVSAAARLAEDALAWVDSRSPRLGKRPNALRFHIVHLVAQLTRSIPGGEQTEHLDLKTARSVAYAIARASGATISLAAVKQMTVARDPLWALLQRGRDPTSRGV